MNKNLQFVGTLIAAALLSAGTAHAQTGNGGLRGVVGGTLSTLRINISVQGGNNARAAQVSATRTRVGLVGSILRPYGRPGARGMAAGTSPASSDGSLPGLDEADAQMREEGSDLSGDESGSTNDGTSSPDGMGGDTMQTTTDAGDATDDGADDMADAGEAGLEPTGYTRRTGTSDRTTNDFSTSRGTTSRVSSVGVLGVSIVQFGRTTTHSSQQQGRRNTRSTYRNNETTYAPPAPETPAEEPADGTDTTTDGTATEGSGEEAAGTTTEGDGTAGSDTTTTGDETAGSGETTTDG